MSEITQPPPDVQSQDTSSRVNRLGAASDQNASNKQSTEQQRGKKAAELEPEKAISHHDPAVTLASTLAKLDQGSYFTATVSGSDGDGRTIINSELGTYLVEGERRYIDDIKKFHKEELLEIKVLTIDKEIKAEIIRPPAEGATSRRPTAIPVTLTLTELGHSGVLTPPTSTTAQSPLDDIKSQYQATTLYKAERIAREIGDKLDNLPLPTSSPNYTVYGAKSSLGQENIASEPRQVSNNVFIQEVPSLIQSENISPSAEPKNVIDQILGQNINVQVIKSVPRSPITLQTGLPEAVLKEINALTPLDYVKVGQNINITIAAVAIPEANEKPLTPTPLTQQAENAPAPPQPQTPQQSTSSATNISPSSKVPDPQQPAPVTQQAVSGALISGIVIDTNQKSTKENKNQGAAISSRKSTIALENTPYHQKNKPKSLKSGVAQTENTAKNYYIATPTSVLKFHSSTPLVPGTIVSFTVQSSPTTPQTEVQSEAKTNVNPVPSSTTAKAAINQQTQPTASPENTGQQTTSITPGLSEKIDYFMPQELEQLAQDWASISMALSALVSTTSTAMAAIMSSRIPNMQSPDQLTSTIFFFLSALKAPQPARTWLGPEVAGKLKRLGAGKVVDRINHDFSRIARLGAESPPGDWRPILIPLQNGPEITAVPMLTKQIVDEEHKNKGEQKNDEDDTLNIKATRFILEVKFSQFGTMLIDGLLKDTRLDIILKSAKAIPLSIKMKLSSQYTVALEQNNFEGELVIIDKTPTEFSVKKIIETMSHKIKYEKKI